MLAVLSVPELDAEAEQKKAPVEETEAKLAQAKASEEVAQANLASAQAKLTEVQAGTKRADADLARWQAEFQRVEQLFNERAQTGSLLDETRSKLGSAESRARKSTPRSRRPRRPSGRARPCSTRPARRDRRRGDHQGRPVRRPAHPGHAGYATIVAPYDGVITRRNVDVGDLTEPGTQGQPLFIVARDDFVRIIVSVPEMYATEVDPGDRVLIRLQALPGRDFEGKVTRTSWTLDAKNRTLRTEIDVPNPDGMLRPGLYAYATVVVEEHPDALSVPTSALVRQDSKTFVSR